MNGDQLAAWILSVRSPKGAKNYHRCRRCQPALPVAYTFTASDVSLNA